MGLPRQQARPQTQLSRLEAHSGRRAPRALSQRPKQTPRQPMQRVPLRRTALRSSVGQRREQSRGLSRQGGPAPKQAPPAQPTSWSASEAWPAWCRGRWGAHASA